MGVLDFTDEEIRAFEDENQRWLRESTAIGPEEVGGCTIYLARLEGSGIYECSEEKYRIVCQYDAAKRRQGDAEDACMQARGWAYPEEELAEEDEPAPEAIPPAGKLTARQVLFCEHYAAQPVAARAAVLAGYADGNATNHGSRLLKNPLVLARIAELRAEKKLSYVLEADTLHDKLEAVFFEAIGDRNHAAAVSALRLQAGLARLPTRSSAPAIADNAAEADADAPADAPRPRRAARKAYKSRSRRRKKPTKAYK
jgi:phage terminase small subunit